MPAVRPNGASANVWLHVKGTQLCNEAGKPVVVRRMRGPWHIMVQSVHSARNPCVSGGAWGQSLPDSYVYREGGYLSQPEEIKARVIAAADAAIEQDLYVIIDRHILSDGNPMAHAAEAEAFFSQMAMRYRDMPNVLYEICNEPNRNVSWSRDVKPYAERMIRAVRAASPQAVILVGSPTWSQDIHLAAEDPLEGENLMYTTFTRAPMARRCGNRRRPRFGFDSTMRKRE